MNGYNFDVFLSYPRKNPVDGWIKNHFFPQLKAWLPESLPHEPNIFIDIEMIETGAEWPIVLREALSRSRCLVPVFCPSYFRSKWCCSELESIRRREAAMGFRSPGNPAGLIYPVVFWDGEFFPRDASTIHHRNLSTWAQPHVAFSQTLAYADFTAAMQSFCKDLARMILKAPEWDSTWPAIELPSPTSPEVPLPRVR